MKLAFALFHYFPYGGLERDMLAIARTCAARGHEVVIYTQSWEGEKPAGIAVVELPVGAFSNHARGRQFAQRLERVLRTAPVDAVVGFNKMPGLDVYFAADVCFAEKAFESRSWWYRLSSRCRGYLALEKAVFAQTGQTDILLITPAQLAPFRRYYQTPDARLHILPPGIRRDRVMPDDYAEQRAALRRQYGLTDNDRLLLMVGSDFRRKGVMRSLRALAALPEPLRKHTQLWVAGQDKPQAVIAEAQALGVGEQFKVLGARDDVAQLMWAADIFLHPAHSEAAGAVLLEAMVAGLPVITTDVCGYAHYVAQQQMGLVLRAQDADGELAAAIAKIAAQPAAHWRERARQFVAREDVFSMTERAALVIEQTAQRKRG